MNSGNRLGVAAPYRNLLRSERVPRLLHSSGQDRPLDLSIGTLTDDHCQPIDLRQRSGTWVGRVSKGTDVCKAWHHVRLNRRNEPLPFYSPPKSLPPCHSLTEKFILQKESATEVESARSKAPSVPSSVPTMSKVQNSLFGSTQHCPKSDKVSSSNTSFAPPLGNPFKKVGDASPEQGNKSILAPSKFGNFSNTNTGSNFVFGSNVVKPSSFSSLSAKPQVETFVLKPSVLSNSFKRHCDVSDEDSITADTIESKRGKIWEQQKEKESGVKIILEDKVEPHTLSKDSTDTNEQPSLFVPLTNQSEAIKSSDDTLKPNGVSASSSQSGFIFGQNLLSKSSDHNRVGSIFAVNSTHGDNKTENLFCEAVSVLPTDQMPQPDWTSGKSLIETSRELTEREQNLKRKYDEVEVVTGEEDESNVIQMVCKLYSWNSGSWQERGRGILRLNDKAVNNVLFSRLVVRTQGTLTIMLNTKVWAEMSVEKVNDKSVRFTACDADGQPKLFLVIGAPKDVEILYTSLDYRIFESKLKKTQNSEDNKD